MSLALYRKYRSKCLDEIVGQTHITKVLAQAFKKDMVAHAYLLTGPRGVGKTSIARIMAREINKLPYSGEDTNLDIIEIDAASNNGVEDVRDLREKVHIAPVAAKKKVYIIDEVHMLSKPAFNALLKTLEEPPEHVVFILATTNDDKLPATIISRTQHFRFRNITPNEVAKHLKYIAKKEKIAIDDEALLLIANRGGGSFRDSISLLDQVRLLGDGKAPIRKHMIEASLGLATAEVIENLINAYKAGDVSAVIETLEQSQSSGTEAQMLAAQLINAVRLKIPSEPQLLGLLDGLLDVNKSSHPAVKLLIVLASKALSKPKTMALKSDTKVISSKLAELSRQAETLAPVMTPVLAPELTASPAPLDFSWQRLVEYTREHAVAIYSVIKKCGYLVENEKLIIYTGSNFYKKKLDDTKYRHRLLKALREAGGGNLTLETIASSSPPKNSQAAMVAVIMGGGEEVSVDLAQ